MTAAFFFTFVPAKTQDPAVVSMPKSGPVVIPSCLL